MQVLVLLIPLVVYFPLRYVALDHHLTRTEFVAALMNPIATAAGLGRVIAPFTVLGHYVRLLLVPARLSCDYGMAILDPRQGVTAMTLLGMAGAGALAVGLFGLTRRTAGGRLVGLLTAMFLVSYALISNAVLLIGVDLAERFMYWPSVPLLMLLAVGVVELGRRYCAPGRPLAASGRRLRILGVLLVAALGVRSLVRNTDWASNGALFQTDVRTYPQGAHLNRGCALELLRYWEHASPSGPSREAFEAARRYLDRALAIHPGYVEALALRGEVRAQLGDIDGALLDVEAATQLNPNDRVARKTFARLMYGENPDERLRESRAAVAAHPEDAAAHLDLGRALLECGGRATEAEQQLEVAARLAPDSAEPLRELGKALALEHKHDQAVAVLERGVALAPQDWQIHANLASLLGAQRPAEALLHAERAYELKPGEPRNSINLAEAYAVNGQTANAIAWYQKVEQQLDQDDPLREVVAQRLEFLRSRR
jgi:tetratricopeptide (TPR) repeat protein